MSSDYGLASAALVGEGLVIINNLLVSHGPLMVSGFLGTLIGLERAVALQKRWVFLGPLLCGIGGIFLIFHKGNLIGQSLITLSSLIMLAALIGIVRKIFVSYTSVMVLGTLLWFVGNFLWLLNFPIYKIVNWWIGFFVLTIASERLELSRISRTSSRSQILFILIISFYIFSLIITVTFLDLGVRLIALSLITLTIWLLINDIARFSIRKLGLPKYTAICLLGGYFWLGISGILSFIYGATPAGFKYDAVLHSVFLGFVFSMVFGHAPIILPVVLKKPIRFHSSFYSYLILLNFSLVLRIIGDIVIIPSLRMWGGLMNEIAIILFFIVLLFVVQFKSKSFPKSSPQPISFT